MSGFAGVVAASKAVTVAGSFAFDPAKTGTGITLSSGNTVITRNSPGGSYVSSLSVSPFTTSDTYSSTINLFNGSIGVGVGLGNSSTVFTDYLGSTTNSIGVFTTGMVFLNGVSLGSVGFTFTTGDVIGMQITGTSVRFNKNGGTYSTTFTHSIVGTLYCGNTVYNTSDQITGSL